MAPQPDLPALIGRARSAPADAASARRAVALLELSGLEGDANEGEIVELCERAVRHRTAAVCIASRHLGIARRELAGSGVRLATMANFPHGSEDIAAAADEVAAAVADGADEIDVLAPTEAIREGDIGIVGELVQACRIAAGERTVLKLTLDTGMLAEPDIVTAVARAAVMAGAGFLAAARGQPFSGDGLEAVATLLAACAEASGEVGLKVADAHMTAADAAACMALGDAVVGAGWASPGRFRLGGPHLLDALLALER